MPGQASTVGIGHGLDGISKRGTATTYVALLTAAPTATTTVTTMAELVAAGYSRQAVAWTVPSGSPRSTSNSNLLTFGPFTADPAAVSHLALVTTEAGPSGDLVWFWTANAVVDAIVNDTITAQVGALVMQGS